VTAIYVYNSYSDERRVSHVSSSHIHLLCVRLLSKCEDAANIAAELFIKHFNVLLIFAPSCRLLYMSVLV